MTRSMIVLGHDWFESWVSASSTVSHELGHNFGLRHAPCGDAPGPDPAYPNLNGGVGSWVHWVSAWEHGTATFAETINPTRGDFMSYCSSGFASAYHTRAMIEWRTLADASLRQPAVSVPVIMVRGLLTETGITLRRPEITTGEPILGGGTVQVELLAADGRVLSTGSATTGRLSDDTAVPFTAIIPLAAAWSDQVARVRVRAGRRQAEVLVVREH